MSEAPTPKVAGKLTITISEELDGLLKAAGREIAATHKLDSDEEIALLLLKRGARATVDYRASADYRSVASISVAELADVLGIANLEEARRNSVLVHEQQQRAVVAVESLFKTIEGITGVHHLRRLATAEEIDAFATSLKTTIEHHAAEKVKVVLALAFEQTRAILTAIVRAKRAGVPHAEAWSLAFDLVDQWGETEAESPRPSSVTCPECEAILPNYDVAIDGAKSDREPMRIDCGPVHVLHYETAFVEVIEGKGSIHRREITAPSVVVFGEGEGSNDSDGVSGGAAGSEAGERAHGGSPGDRGDDG